MKKVLFIAAAALMFVACTKKNSYTVTGTVEGGADGDVVYMQKNRSEVADSAKITNGKFTFTGAQDSAVICYVSAPAQSLILDFVLESGNIDLAVTKDDETDLRKGTKNNDVLQSCGSKLTSDAKKMQTLLFSIIDENMTGDKLDSSKKEILSAIESYNSNLTNTLNENKGAFICNYIKLKFKPINMTAEDLDQLIATEKAAKEADAKTAVGQKFTDFKIEHGNLDGSAVSLSKYVGKGKYVLVDFWASWCKPCRAEIPNIKAVYEKYKGKNFDVVSVAVWDKHDNTMKAIEEEKISWNQIIDTDKIPTDIYGIAGIPHIILFAPDGTILARNLRGEDIESKIKEVLGK